MISLAVRLYSSPLKVFIENGLLFVDATIFIREFPPFRVRHNQYDVLLPGWDINSVGNTILEVVDNR